MPSATVERDLMGKSTAPPAQPAPPDPSPVYKSVKLLEDFVLKANTISLATGERAQEYLSRIIGEQTTIERDYASALRKLDLRKRG